MCTLGIFNETSATYLSAVFSCCHLGRVGGLGMNLGGYIKTFPLNYGQTLVRELSKIREGHFMSFHLVPNVSSLRNFFRSFIACKFGLIWCCSEECGLETHFKRFKRRAGKMSGNKLGTHELLHLMVRAWPIQNF